METLWELLLGDCCSAAPLLLWKLELVWPVVPVAHSCLLGTWVGVWCRGVIIIEEQKHVAMTTALLQSCKALVTKRHNSVSDSTLERQRRRDVLFKRRVGKIYVSTHPWPSWWLKDKACLAHFFVCCSSLFLLQLHLVGPLGFHKVVQLVREHSCSQHVPVSTGRHGPKRLRLCPDMIRQFCAMTPRAVTGVTAPDRSSLNTGKPVDGRCFTHAWWGPAAGGDDRVRFVSGS